MADCGPAFAGDFITLGDIDDVDEGVHEFGGEGGGEIVSTAFNQDQFGVGVTAFEFGDGGEIHAGVVSDGGVGAAARFNTEDAIRGEGVIAGEELGVFAGVDVVGDDGERDFMAQPLT